MQKRYLLPFIFILFFISCQDEEPAPEVYVSDFYPEFYGIDIIKSTYPENGEINVDNLSDIEIEFDKGIYKDNINDTVFEENIFKEDELYKLNNVLQAIRHQYRIVLDSIYVANTNGTLYPGKIQWNEAGTGCTYSLFDVFPGEQTINIKIITHIEELIDEEWTQLIYLDGKEAIYNNTFSFMCIEEADTIISTNILAAYPEDNMLNLYKGEYPEGGIKLFKAQTKCFELGPNETSFVRFTSTDNTFTVDYTVENLPGGGQQVRFPLPEALEHEKIYKMELVRSNSVSKTEKISYSIFFRVSMYNTLKEKLDDSDVIGGYILNHYYKDTKTFYDHAAEIFNKELFDEFELSNISCIAGVAGPGYEDDKIPLIYGHADEMQDLGFVYPNTENGYSVPPYEAAYIEQLPFKDIVSLEDGIVNFPEKAYVANNCEYIFYLDYRKLNSFVHNYKYDIPDELVEYFDFVKNNFYVRGSQSHSVTLQYFIPAFDYYGTEKTIWVDR